MRSNDELVEYLIGIGVLKSLDIIRAFSKVDRKNFMIDKFKGRAYEDNAFPIGYGQTISQPTTVAIMMELLQAREQDKVLEIGTGSGYAAAILSFLVGKEGGVITTEIIPALKEFAEENIDRLKIKNIEFYDFDGSKGNPSEAPFDRIIAAAAPERIPESLKKQMSENSRMVIPVGRFVQKIVLIKSVGKTYSRRVFPGFMFVAMREKG